MHRFLHGDHFRDCPSQFPLRVLQLELQAGQRLLLVRVFSIIVLVHRFPSRVCVFDSRAVCFRDGLALLVVVVDVRLQDLLVLGAELLLELRSEILLVSEMRVVDAAELELVRLNVLLQHAHVLGLQFREFHFATSLGCSASFFLGALDSLQVVFAPQEQLPLSKAILQLDPVRRLEPALAEVLHLSDRLEADAHVFCLQILDRGDHLGHVRVHPQKALRRHLVRALVRVLEMVALVLPWSQGGPRGSPTCRRLSARGGLKRHFRLLSNRVKR
mmetsp:Transcript_10678/g.26148  ORF Transcript_10678/g.26148 Transcript_10678/m.26148 type:complete len:273 (+) Transcript_10678:740-1558(+)